MQTEQEIREQTVIDVAKKMAVAARTAPKARGVDNLQITILTGSNLQRLSDKMREMGQQVGREFFVRDAACVDKSQAVLLIGTDKVPLGLDCALCGFATCATKPHDVPCIFNTNDMGIAVGSAVSIAADNRIDNRIMFSIGKAASALGMQTASVVLGIALSVSNKSPFFDRG